MVDAPADQVRARIGRWATVEPAGDVRCRVRMSTDSLDWPLMALGTVGAEFSVVSPPELVDRLRIGAAGSAGPRRGDRVGRAVSGLRRTRGHGGRRTAWPGTSQWV